LNALAFQVQGERGRFGVFLKETAPFGDKEAASIGVIRKGFSPEVGYCLIQQLLNVNYFF
jgi:hypothetical protein